MTLPAGLTWREPYAPQHDDGKSKRATNSAAKQGAPTAEKQQADPKGQTGTGAGTPPPCAGDNMMWIMLAMFAVIYFFMIRPGQKQEKQIKEMRKGLIAGDTVVTNSGMHGTIVEVDEQAQTVTIQADEEGRVRLKFDTGAISRKVTDDGAPAADAKS